MNDKPKVRFGADFFYEHFMQSDAAPEPQTIQDREAARMETSRRRGRLVRSIRDNRSGADAEQTNLQEKFERIARRGAAAEMGNLLLEIKREMDLLLKQGRLGKTSRSLYRSFLAAANRAIEERKWSAANRSGGAQTPDAASKDGREPAAAELCRLYNQLNKQIREDENAKAKLIETFNRCKQYLPSKERGRLEVKLREQLAKSPLERQIHILGRLIETLASNVPAIRKNEVQILFGEAREAFAAGDHERTMGCLDRLFRYDRNHLDGHRLRAELYRQKGNAFAWLCELRVAAESAGAAPGDWFAYAGALREKGQMEEALSFYRFAAHKAPAPRHLKHWGTLAMELGEWDQAEAALSRWILAEPWNPEPLHHLGWLYFNRNQFEKAFEYLDRGLKLDENNPQSWLCAGRVYRHHAMGRLAVKAFRRALELGGENAEVLYWLGITLLDTGDFESAAVYGRRCFELDPGRVRNACLLARCLASNGSPAGAADALEPFAGRKGCPADAVALYSEYCRAAGRAEKAMAIIEPLFKAHPWQPQIKAEYGLLLAELNQWDKVMELLPPAEKNPTRD